MNPPERGQPQESVLLIFLHGLGDSVMFTGPLREYHKAHPAARISLLLLNNGSPEILRHNPHVAEILVSPVGPHYWNPMRYWWDRWALQREVWRVCRQKHFDRVIHVSIACMPELYYRLTGSYGAHKTVRIAHDLGIPAEHLTPELHLSLDTPGAEAFIGQNQLQRFAVLHPFSRYARRGLEPAAIQQVIERLRARGLQVVLAGRNREVAGIALQGVVPAVDLPLNRLLAIISRAELFLGTESGIAHLAGTVARKMVLLSTRTKRLQLTNCGPLTWGIPYCKGAVEILEMALPEPQRQSALSEILRRLQD